MDSQEEALLREKLADLRVQHRELDQKIADAEMAATHDQITMKRLKNRS